MRCLLGESHDDDNQDSQRTHVMQREQEQGA
jgi:hypothetical protein